MKVITFFTEKGGVGKTTLSIMFASWLAYEQRAEVTAIDYDDPSYQFYNARKNDTKLYNSALMNTNILANNNPDSPDTKERINLNNKMLIRFVGQNRPYLIIKHRPINSGEDLANAVDAVRKMKSDHADDGSYLILDFPGRFRPNDISFALCKAGLVDLVIYIADSDRQTRDSVRNINKVLHVFGQKCCILWNRETQGERRSESAGKKDWYSSASAQFRSVGIDVISTRVRDIPIARRDSDTSGFVRNTLCWPSSNVKRNCAYMEDVFAEVKARLDGSYVEPENTEEI